MLWIVAHVICFLFLCVTISPTLIHFTASFLSDEGQWRLKGTITTRSVRKTFHCPSNLLNVFAFVLLKNKKQKNIIKVYWQSILLIQFFFKPCKYLKWDVGYHLMNLVFGVTWWMMDFVTWVACMSFWSTEGGGRLATLNVFVSGFTLF